MRSPSHRRTPAGPTTRTAVAALAVALLTSALGCESNNGSPDRALRSRRSGSSATGARGGERATTPGGGSDQGETRSAAVRDKRSQRSTSGEVPSFVEIDAARIEGDLDSLTLSMTLAGKVPELMPDEVTTMRVTFTLVTRSGDRYEFVGHCTRNGWALFASGREDAEQPFLDDIAISGRGIAMSIDRGYLGPPDPFKWTANVAWTRRADRGEAYAFDLVPTRGYADFP